MSQGVGVALGGIILDTAMRNKSSVIEHLRGVLMESVQRSGQYFPSAVLGEEADDLGLIYSAGSYDESIHSVWQKMKSRSRRKMPQFLSHPDSGKRIEYLQAHAVCLDFVRSAKKPEEKFPSHDKNS